MSDELDGFVEVTLSEYNYAAALNRPRKAVQRYYLPKPVRALPQSPGFYFGAGSCVVELLNVPPGQWVDAGDRTYLGPDQVRELMPLTRLVTEADAGLSGKALEHYTKDREFELLQALTARIRARELEFVRDTRVLTEVLAEFGYVE